MKNNSYNIYINAMTGHTPSTEQSQEFLSTMHTMIDNLDTISSDIDENIYLGLVNGLHRLYNIHNSGTQTSSNVRETSNQRHIYRENLQTNNEVQINRMLARHYGRVYDSSGALISNEPYPINDDITTIISDANTINANTGNTNTNNNPIITNILNNNTNNTDNDNEFNQELLQESVAYRALYNNADYDYWNQAH
jgi:hypothetical protein